MAWKTGWRDAYAIQQFRSELDTLWPDRSTTADGDIGDTRHQHEISGHNPNKDGVVRADDVTNDPTNGPNLDDLAEYLRTECLDRLEYVIWNGRMFSRYYVQGYAPGTWRPYDGSDPHTGHLHLSVGTDTYPYQGQGGNPARYDNRAPWGLENIMGLSAADKQWLETELVPRIVKDVWSQEFPSPVDAGTHKQNPAWQASSFLGNIAENVYKLLKAK